MEPIVRIDALPQEHVDDPQFVSAMKTLRVGDAAGSKAFYVNIDFVKPGGLSTKYHAHSGQEEFFLILSGTGHLRMDGQTYPVKPGDAVSKQPGCAHQFLNDGAEVLQILDVGTRCADDVCTYPDEDVVLIRRVRAAYSLGSRLEGWSSDPNPSAE